MSDTAVVFRARFLTVSQVAERLQVHRRTVLGWIETGRLEAMDIGSDQRPLYRIAEGAVAKVAKKTTNNG